MTFSVLICGAKSLPGDEYLFSVHRRAFRDEELDSQARAPPGVDLVRCPLAGVTSISTSSPSTGWKGYRALCSFFLPSCASSPV